MLADHGGNITDPRFIPTGADGTSGTTHNIINRALGDKQEPIDDCNVVSKMSRVWAQPSTKTIRSRPIQREELLNTSIPMSNITMVEVLNLLQDQCNLIDIADTDLFNEMSDPTIPCIQIRRFFKPRRKENWTTTKNKYPCNDTLKLCIPISLRKDTITNKWACVFRLGRKGKPEHP